MSLSTALMNALGLEGKSRDEQRRRMAEILSRPGRPSSSDISLAEQLIKLRSSIRGMDLQERDPQTLLTERAEALAKQERISLSEAYRSVARAQPELWQRARAASYL
jgi:hypothetical protein